MPRRPLPMRRREHVVGVLTLLDAEPGGMQRDDIDLGQALAEVTTIEILLSAVASFQNSYH
ncbi:hypothetical protein [Amycolatopsis sp. cmx-4-54]|uniref:hypothetical protein n=1 Tax=Amycolatopsis sp. cmx-4-54 TaxID=2790936 RepID=UPI00397E231A